MNVRQIKKCLKHAGLKVISIEEPLCGYGGLLGEITIKCIEPYRPQVYNTSELNERFSQFSINNDLIKKSFLNSVFGEHIDFVIVNKIKETTVVKFKSGKLGKVKCNGEKFDVEKGIAMAIVRALTNYKELNKMLENLDSKIASKSEKGLAIYLAKKEIGDEEYSNAIKNAKIIEKEEEEKK